MNRVCGTKLDKVVGSASVVGIFYILAKFTPDVIREHFFGVFLFLTLAFFAIFSDDGTFLSIKASETNEKEEKQDANRY